MRESAVNAHRRDSQFTALHKSNKRFTNIVQHAKHITLSGQLPRESTTSRIHHRTTHTHTYIHKQTGSTRKLSKLVPVLLKWNCNLELGTSKHQSEESLSIQEQEKEQEQSPQAEQQQIKYKTPKFNSYLFITVCSTVFTICVFLKPNYFN